MSADRSNNPWLFDLRLRERNVRSGALDEKELTRHLGALKDLESETETFGWAQPAIGDGMDVEEEDEDDDDGVEAAEEAPAVAAAAAPEGE
jgi:hypothetical protein